MHEGNIRVVTSAGDECFVCEKRIADGDTVILVEFKVNLVLVSPAVEKQAHVDCAEKLNKIIAGRVVEARKRGRIK